MPLSPIEAEERAVLRRFYNTTGGPLWDKADYWCNSNVSHCDWHGVTCERGRVTRLSLYRNNLTGTIPPELGNLSQLTHFFIYNNHISGTIPPELGQLSKLTNFDIRNNEVSGTIPRELGNLSQLTYFDIDTNQISGTIPPELGRNRA